MSTKKIVSSTLSKIKFALNIATFLRNAMHANQFIVQKFYKDGCLGKASSLGYATILSFLPVIVLLFTFFSYTETTRMFLLEKVRDGILHFLLPIEGDNVKLVLQSLQHLSHNVGTISTIGITWLILLSFDIVVILEDSMDTIWKISNKRLSILHKMLTYWAFITLLPIFIVVYFYCALEWQPNIQGFNSSYFFTCVFSIITFFLFYHCFPKTKVQWKASLPAAVFSGCLWEIGKSIFIFYTAQIGHQTIGRLYGHLYLLPIFMAWIYYGYVLLLLGAELSYFLQNRNVHFPSHIGQHIAENFPLLQLNTLIWLHQRFIEAKTPLRLHELAKLNFLNPDDMLLVMQNMNAKKMTHEIHVHTHPENPMFILARPLEAIMVNQIVRLGENPSTQQFAKTLGSSTQHAWEFIKKQYNNNMQALETISVAKIVNQRTVQTHFNN